MEAAAAAAAPPQPAAAQPGPPLPSLPDDVFLPIAAKLDARMLGRLGCTAQRFWRPCVPDPAHKPEDGGAAELWSVVEEGARRRLCAEGAQVRGWVSRETSGGSWLRALAAAEKMQRPLVFTAHHATVTLSEEGTVATNEVVNWRSAVCGGHEMTAGVHCAHFRIWGLCHRAIMVGVVGPGFDPAAGEGVLGGATESAEGWVLRTYNGQLGHGGEWSNWPGQPEAIKRHVDVVVRRPRQAAPRRACADGAVCACRAWCSTSTPAGETPTLHAIACASSDVGCRVRSLTVWLNGERRGVMVRSGLVGPLRWAADVAHSAIVRIDGPYPPPSPPWGEGPRPRAGKKSRHPRKQLAVWGY